MSYEIIAESNQKPILKIKILVSQSQKYPKNTHSIIKKLKNSNAFLKTSPKIGDKAFF
ncbi:hypothetical protein TH0144_10110 [Helicobacter pylori]